MTDIFAVHRGQPRAKHVFTVQFLCRVRGDYDEPFPADTAVTLIVESPRVFSESEMMVAMNKAVDAMGYVPVQVLKSASRVEVK